MKQELLEAIHLIISDQTETATDVLRLKALLDAGININAKIDPKSLDLLQYDKNGFSLLHLAVVHCKNQMVDVLLASNQANLQLVDKDGLTALHMVASYRDYTQQVLQSEAMLKEKQIAEAIIKHSNAIDLRDKAGNTALHKAAINGNVYVVELLLKKDYLFPQQKLLSIKNKHGNTVLHEVVQNGKQGKQILSLLMRVASQQDLEVKNNLDETPIELVDRLIKERDLFRIKFPELLFLLNSLFQRFNSSPGITIRADPVAMQIIPALTKEIGDLVNSLAQLPMSTYHVLTDITSLIAQLLKYKILSQEILFNLEFITFNAQSEIHRFLESNTDSIKELNEVSATLQQRDYLVWKENVANLPSSFTDYQKSLPNPQLLKTSYLDDTSSSAREAKRYYELGVYEFNQLRYTNAIEQLINSLQYYDQAPYLVGYIGVAHTYYVLGLSYKKQAEQFTLHDSDNYKLAQKYLELGRDIFLNLQDYFFLEKAYLALTEIQIKQLNSDYEKKQLTIITNKQSNLKEKIGAHFALASLYNELNNRRYASSSVYNPVLEQLLITYESHHYRLAYELSQGPVDPDAQLILQREMGVGHDIKLGTTNIQQCVAIFAFEPRRRKLVLAHFDKFSGPLSFIEQLLSQFSEEAKLEIYLSGGRDRSELGRPVSDNNINQVLKQLYTYKDRITILASDLGDKVSPPAVIFDPQTKRLIHGVAQPLEKNLIIRAAQMNLNLNKLGNIDYLYPLTLISDQTEYHTKDFTALDKQQLKALCRRYYSQCYTQQSYIAWYHNQLLYPLLMALNTAQYVEEDFNRPLVSIFGPIENNVQTLLDQSANLPLFSTLERFSSNLDLLSMVSEQSMIDETAENDEFPYLNQEDIADIGHIAFNSFRIINGESRFEVLSSEMHLEKQLQEFKNRVSANVNAARLTSIINLSNTRWVSLVLNYRKEDSWQAFYVDSRHSDSIPAQVSGALSDVVFTLVKLDYDESQVNDVHSGLWALETAALVNQLINDEDHWQGADWKTQLDKKGINNVFFENQREHYSTLLSGHFIRSIRSFRSSTTSSLKVCIPRKKRHVGHCVADDPENYRGRLNLLQLAEEWKHELASLGLQSDWVPLLNMVKQQADGSEQITFHNLFTHEEKVIRLTNHKTLQFRGALQKTYRKLNGLLKFSLLHPELTLQFILNNENGMMHEPTTPLQSVEAIDGLNAVFTLQALITFFQQKSGQEFQIEQDPLSLALQIHSYVNLIQMGHGMMMDGVRLANLVKTLTHQKIHQGLYEFRFATKSLVTERVGLVLSITSVGLDIKELTKAKIAAERNLFATQLAFDISGVLLSARAISSSHLLSPGMAIGFVGEGAIFSGLNIGIMGLVQAYNEVAAKTDSVGEYFYLINEAYEHFGYERIVLAGEKNCLLSPYSVGAIITEIDFEKGFIHYGSQFIYRTTPRSRGVFGDGKMNYISWAGDMPRVLYDKKQALNIRERLGYPAQIELGIWTLCTTWILPYTPVSYMAYSWTAVPFATFLNDRGFSILRKLEEKRDFDYDFYIFPSEYIISEITEERISTDITIHLDNQKRTFVIPSFPDYDRELYTLIHYTFSTNLLSEGGQCQLYLNSIASIQFKETSSTNYIWIINAEGLIDDTLRFTKTGITVGDIPIHIIPNHLSTYYFVDQKGAATFLLDFAQTKLISASINYQQVQTLSSSLQNYLQQLHLLQANHSSWPSLLTLTHFPLQDEYGNDYLGKAYYAVAENQMIFTARLPEQLNAAADLIHFTEDSAYFFDAVSNYFWRSDSQHHLVENYVFLSEFMDEDLNTRFLAGAILAITWENGIIRVVQPFTNAGNETQRQAVYHIVESKPLLTVLCDDELLVHLHVYSLLINTFNLTNSKTQESYQNELQNLCANQILRVKLANDPYTNLSRKVSYAELNGVIRITSLNQTFNLPTLWVRHNKTNYCRLINPRMEKSAIYLGSLQTSAEKEVFYFFTPHIRENLGQLYRQMDGEPYAKPLNSLSNLTSAFFSDQNTLLAFTSEGVIKKVDALGKAYTMIFTKEWVNNQTAWWQAVPLYLSKHPPASTNIPLLGISDPVAGTLAAWYNTQNQQYVFASPPQQAHNRPLQLAYLGLTGDKNFFYSENKTVYYQTVDPLSLSAWLQGSPLNYSLTSLNTLVVAEQAHLSQQKIWLQITGLLFSLLPQALSDWSLEKIYFQWFGKNNCINQYETLDPTIAILVKNEAQYFRYCFNSAFLSCNDSFIIPRSFAMSPATFSFANAILIPIERRLNTVTHWWYPLQEQFFSVPENKNGSEWVFLAKTPNQNHYFFSPKERIIYILPADTALNSKKPYQTLATELALRSTHTFLWLLHAPNSPAMLSVPLFVGVEVLELDVRSNRQYPFTLHLSDQALNHYRSIAFQVNDSKVESINSTNVLNKLYFDLIGNSRDKLSVLKSEQDIIIVHTQHRCQLSLVNAMRLAPLVALATVVKLEMDEINQTEISLLDIQNKLKASDEKSFPLWSTRFTEDYNIQKLERKRRHTLDDYSITEQALTFYAIHDRIQAHKTSKRGKRKINQGVEKAQNKPTQVIANPQVTVTILGPSQKPNKKEQRFKSQGYLFKPEKTPQRAEMKRIKHDRILMPFREKTYYGPSKLNQIPPSTAFLNNNLFKGLSNRQKKHLSKELTQTKFINKGYLPHDQDQKHQFAPKKIGISRVITSADIIGGLLFLQYSYPQSYRPPLPKKMLKFLDKVKIQKNSAGLQNKYAIRG